MRLHFQIKQKFVIFQFLQCQGGLLFVEHVPLRDFEPRSSQVILVEGTFTFFQGSYIYATTKV